MTDNTIHAAESDEWRSAGYGAGEVERAQACGHTGRVHAVCPDCGDDVRSEL